jgi:phosphoacetylglucosamine mutase
MSSDSTTTKTAVAETPMRLVETVPLSDGLPFYNYGTAGFRFKAEFMDGLMVRVGMLSMMLLLLDQEDPPNNNSNNSNSKTTPLEVSTGVMITASHNDESYNGVKLANPDGSMLTPSQENFLTKWVNERDSSVLEAFLEHKAQQIVRKFEQRLVEHSDKPVIFFLLNIGRDTRSHSKKLSELLAEGAQAFMECVGAASSEKDPAPIPVGIRDHGILTTPMLHHIVLHSNPQHLPSYIQPKNTRTGYLETYASAYVDLLGGLKVSSSGLAKVYVDALDGIYADDNNEASGALRIDGACGVGHRAARELYETITNLARAANETEPNNESSSSSQQQPVTPTVLEVHNGELDGPLNDSCGSEHVQKQLSPPTWYSKQQQATSFVFPYCCSLDGDADRIVFFGQSSETDLSNLLDGDKIAILIAHVLKEKFREATEAAGEDGSQELPPVTIGIVQTAYANGASTAYVKDTLKLPVVIAKTGVKHLHHAAVEHFDVGIYFEANGHGTVVFSEQYQDFATQCRDHYRNPFFVRLHKLINPAVGDALSDMLLVDYLLRSLGGWTLSDWNTKLYDDLPSRMLKVRVSDRTVIRCNSNESVCLAPSTVQPLLQAAMDRVPSGRTFVRPSGTEDVVRVYAEAQTRGEADALALEAAKIVFATCDGVGTPPGAGTRK